MKIRPVGAELFHADGQTDMTKLIVAFFCCNFANAPKKEDSELKTLLGTDSGAGVQQLNTYLVVVMSDVASGLGKSEHELLHSSTSMFWPSCQQPYKVHNFTYSSVK